MYQNRWRPWLHPEPRWGSSRRSPRAPSRLGRGPHTPSRRRLRRLDSCAFGARPRRHDFLTPLEIFCNSSTGAASGVVNTTYVSSACKLPMLTSALLSLVQYSEYLFII